MIARHYGMDWLRIGAFGLLILYHVAMVFVPWDFHVNSTHTAPWLRLPMLATNAWRLTLLFVVSGYASRALLARSDGTRGFLASRSYRLLLPLAFGIAVIVPPQAWAELTIKHGYAGGFLDFWWHDYFRFRPLAGLALPSWNHLWFVAYLWVYTAILSIGAALMRRSVASGTVPKRRSDAFDGNVSHHGAAQRAFDRVFCTGAVLFVPLVWLAGVHGWWFTMAAETHRLFADPVAHLTFLPAFLFGFGLAGSPAAMAAIGRWWKAAALLAVAGYMVVIWIELAWVVAPRALYPLYGIGHALEQWGAIVALVGIAERWGRYDHRWRSTLTEAVFPFYLVHQTIIVVVMAALIDAGLPGWVEFAALLVLTIVGCALFYLGGRRFAWLRPLIGLRAHPAPRRHSRPALI